MGRKGIKINLKSISPEGEVKYFKSIPEAAEGLGFSERGVRKAYHSKRDRIGEYQLEWLKVHDPAETMKRMAESRIRINCIYCGHKLTRADRIDEGFSIMKMSEQTGNPIEYTFVKSLYEARKVSELSLATLINAAEKGNVILTRRRDKQKFILCWNPIHGSCFEARWEERWKSQNC